MVIVEKNDLMETDPDPENKEDTKDQNETKTDSPPVNNNNDGGMKEADTTSSVIDVDQVDGDHDGDHDGDDNSKVCVLQSDCVLVMYLKYIVCSGHATSPRRTARLQSC